MSTYPREVVSNLVLQRVYSEFLEMPGLRLTIQQAQRLWGLDEVTCLALLELLVARRFLCRNGRGTYARLTEGRTEVRPQVAPAGADVIRRSINEVV